MLVFDKIFGSTVRIKCNCNPVFYLAGDFDTTRQLHISRTCRAYKTNSIQLNEPPSPSPICPRARATPSEPSQGNDPIIIPSHRLSVPDLYRAGTVPSQKKENGLKNIFSYLKRLTRTPPRPYAAAAAATEKSRALKRMFEVF